MWKYDRRQFLQGSGMLFGFTALNAQLTPWANALAGRTGDESASAPLYNTNLQTAIGLGDQTPGIVDQFGQLDSRNALLRLALETGPLGAPELHWSQSLAEGYLPIVETQVKSGSGTARWTALAAKLNGIEGEHVEFAMQGMSLRAHLWFPYTTGIQVKDGVVRSGEQILARFPAQATVKVSQAKYNLLTPQRETWPVASPPWSPPGALPEPLPGLDPAFSNGRTSFLFRPLRYSFPVQPGKTYHVILGLILPGSGSDNLLNPSETLLKLSVDGMSTTVPLVDLQPGKPSLHTFVVQAVQPTIQVTSATDPSSTSSYRHSLLNAIWVFEKPVNLDEVASGSLSARAAYYVRCGEEPLEDVACSVSLDIPAGATFRIDLPYQLHANDLAKSTGLLPESIRSAASERWTTFLSGGAEFITGDDRLDQLYKTSLMNIYLLRSKYAGAAEGGQDLYVVKPGATIYNAFWYRDGAYLTAALDVAGNLEEAEKSLRLFWQSHLPGDFGAFAQQESGSWQVPVDELDGQGQALWALVHHAQFSGDRDWLRKVYPNIRKGAAWIESVASQTRILEENGERPIEYGLLPVAEGEAIGHGYIYYHDFWAVLGLRVAVEAAAALNEQQDVKWMTQAYETLGADLLASIKLAFERVALGKYIPATPFDPVSRIDIWGSIAALYPTRFLKPDDPMISATLDLMLHHSEQAEYTYFNRPKLWTYLTADWAMCYLLRGDLSTFSKLFDGYVAHASPTNAWIEEIFIDTRQGTGDMPHGWAAGQYVHLHRNALVFEEEDMLHLCWGGREEWLAKGIRVKRAPSKFGTINFALVRNGSELVLDYNFLQGPRQQTCRKILLHIPPSRQQNQSVRVNGKVRALAANQQVLPLE